jgi:hypothetical protein
MPAFGVIDPGAQFVAVSMSICGLVVPFLLVAWAAVYYGWRDYRADKAERENRRPGGQAPN